MLTRRDYYGHSKKSGKAGILQATIPPYNVTIHYDRAYNDWRFTILNTQSNRLVRSGGWYSTRELCEAKANQFLSSRL